MMNDARRFWLEFCRECGVKSETPFQVWYFGNNDELANELAGLVVSGKKTATASLLSINELKPEIAPIDDGYSVITDFANEPICVIQTTEIRHLPFEEVDAQFAFDEGEGDRSLQDWRDRHWAYFTKEAAENGLEFNERSLICCERFRLHYPQK